MPNHKPILTPRVILLTAIWLALLALAFVVDGPVARWVHDSGLYLLLKRKEYWTHVLAEIAKAPGVYFFTMALGVLVAIVHRDRWMAGGFIWLTGVVPLLNNLLKWSFGRTRPYKLEVPDLLDPYHFHWFRFGLGGILDGKDLSFASGHTSVAFATAAGMAIILPRWRWAWYAIAALVGLERILENAHYVSDVVAAAGLGIGGVYLLLRVCLKVREDINRPAVAVDAK